MVLKYILPVLAVVGVAFALYTVGAQTRALPPAPPVAEPAPAPYGANVPGAGLVEPSTEIIAIGTHAAGVASKVHVRAGDRVKAGDPLFSIDDRSLRAEIAVREAATRAAQAQVDRLSALPRAEEIPPVEARLEEVRSALDDRESQLTMWEQVEDPRAISADEMRSKRFAVQLFRARVRQTETELALLRAGAWKPEMEIAKANLASAVADADRTRTELDRLTVRAPLDAEVLKVNIRPGEYAQTGALAEPLMILGETSVMHIRVDVDENDAWRVHAGAPGIAYIRGNSALKTPVRFVRCEPYVIPKKSLTGAGSERVDTRVLQVIYEFQRKDLPMVYAGQQMDVFIEAAPLGGAKFGVDPGQAATDLGGAKK